MENVNIKINGMPVCVPKNYTILQAAREAGIDIPTLCYLKDINEIGACRICVVEVKGARTKHLTNTRASGSDDALRLIPVSKLSLEGCLEFLAQDELLEVTPENLRIRKQILNHDQRMKAKSKLK